MSTSFAQAIENGKRTFYASDPSNIRNKPMAKKNRKKEPMRLVEDAKNPNTFYWKKGNKTVANVTLYDDGLIELSNGYSAIAIECIGTKDLQVVIGQTGIKVNPDTNALTIQQPL